MEQDVQASSLWWDGAVIYQVYLRSWADSDGDGFGDIPGARSHLGYLGWLGVDAVWLSPSMPSPDQDWGYDVSDYMAVHPQLGTLEDLELFIATARESGIRVLLDLVPNHTSDAHSWFVDALTGPDSEYRDYYIWADPKEGGGAPNNWLDATGSSAWTFHKESGQYYLHNFLKSQPDLNWWNPEIHRRFEEILRFWFDKGVAGFRIDVAHGLYSDAELRDDPPSQNPLGPEDHFGLLETHSKNRPEVHEVYRQWRRIANSYRAPRLLIGETWLFDMEKLSDFYGDNDELDLAFNFPFLFSELSALPLSQVVSQTLTALPRGSIAVWAASNHDVSRFPTRWAKGDTRKVRLALVILCTLPGTLVLYYGDELGLTDVEVPEHLMRDQMTAGVPGARFERDRARAPMPWEPGEGRGFCSPGIQPWLPLPSDDIEDVATQVADPHSVLWLCRSLITFRHSEGLGMGRCYRQVDAPTGVWRYSYGTLEIVANMTEEMVNVDLGEACVVLRSDSSRPPGPSGVVEVSPWEAIIAKAEEDIGGQHTDNDRDVQPQTERN